jgi:hypothetical protein
MELINYRANGQNGQCKFFYKEDIDGKMICIFVQTPQSIPSITNVIEILVTQVIRSGLFPNFRPHQIRIFEHYPVENGHAPIIDWQEVKLSITPGHNWFWRLIHGKAESWIICDAEWFPVGETSPLRQKLAAIIK